jgi:DNA invertase Pin-like site-specific DNA recombinase
MAKIGYARVSTSEQCLDGQHDRLQAIGCDRIFTDIASGSRSDRPEFLAMMDYLREGDTLVVLKFDRIGRSIKHLLDTIHQLDTRGVKVESLTEGLDTSTPGGKLVMHIFAAIAEFERDLIRERTQIGLAAARARGKKGGRKPALNADAIAQVRKLSADKSNSVNDLCQTFGISRSTYYRYIGDNKTTLA